MKKFVKNIALYLIATLAIVILSVVALSERYWAYRQLTIKKAIVERFGGKDISLILGSSHAMFGVDSKYFGANCFNLALPSQSFFEDYHLLKHVLKSKRVEFIVLPISYFTNHAKLSENPLEGEALRIFDYENALNITYPIHAGSLKNRINLISSILSYNLHPPAYNEVFDSNGNYSEPCTERRYDISDSLKAFKRHDANSDFTSRNPYMDSIIAICAANKIKLNFIVFPFTHGYNNQIRKNGPEFESFLEEIENGADSSYCFFDCRHLITENEPLYFRDADHLSPCGRDSLSSYLAKRICK